MQPRDEMQSPPPSAFPSVDVVCPHGDLGVRRGRLQQRATSTFAELSQGPNYAWSITAVRRADEIHRVGEEVEARKSSRRPRMPYATPPPART